MQKTSLWGHLTIDYGELEDGRMGITKGTADASSQDLQAGLRRDGRDAKW